MDSLKINDSIKIIAFGHRQRVGKDTAVKFGLNHLKSIGKKHSYRLSFFNRMKDICHQIYSWGGLEPGIYYDNHPEKKDEILAPIGVSPRKIWIDVGQEINRICPITLCELAFQGLPGGIHLISDLRRPIEAEYIKKFSGICVKINNSRPTKSNDAVDSAMESYNEWDEEIENEGSLKDFNRQIIDLLERKLNL